MLVRELSRRQIRQLKWNMYYGDDKYMPLYNKYEFPDDIPDMEVYERYDGIDFVRADFA